MSKGNDKAMFHSEWNRIGVIEGSYFTSIYAELGSGIEMTVGQRGCFIFDRTEIKC